MFHKTINNIRFRQHALPRLSYQLLAVAVGLANANAYALEAMADNELAGTTGEGLGIVTENFSFVMDDTAYVNITSAGGAAPTGRDERDKKADIYVYGLAFGGSTGGMANRAVAGANLGSATNPAMLTADNKTGLNGFVPNSTYDAHVLSFAMPTKTLDDENLKLAMWADIIARDAVTYTDDYSKRLRLQIVSDQLSVGGTKVEIAKTPSYPTLTYKPSTETTLGISGGLTGERTYGHSNGGTLKPDDSFNSGSRTTTFTEGNALLDNTGVSAKYLLRSVQVNATGDNIGAYGQGGTNLYDTSGYQYGSFFPDENSVTHNRYWYIADGFWGPVFNDNRKIEAKENKQNRTHNRYRQQQIETYAKMYLAELERMSVAYSNKVGITGLLRLNSGATGGLRLSAAGVTGATDPTYAAVANSTDPTKARYGALSVSGAPEFNTQEGMYFQNFDINLPLGQLGYQPLVVYAGGEYGNDLILELARIPNNPAAYNQYYVNYDDTLVTDNNGKIVVGADGNPTFSLEKDATGNAIVGLTRAQGWCTPTDCPETATHGTIYHSVYMVGANGTKHYGVGRSIDQTILDNPSQKATLEQSFAGANAGIGITGTGVGTSTLAPKPTLDATNFVPLNHPTYNSIEGIMIQHLKVTSSMN